MKTAVSVFATAAAMSLASWAIGQEEQVPQESTTQSTEMTVIAGDGMAAPMIFSSESINGGTARIMMGTGGGGMSFLGAPGMEMNMPAPDPWSMLSNPSVLKDLELVGEQKDKVTELQQKFQREMQAKIGDLSKGGINPDRFKGIDKLMKQLKDEQKSEMEKLLLPHQIDRLRQVALQTHMKQAGTAGALVSEKVAEALSISDDQKERLKTRQKELKEKLAKDIEALKKKAKDDLLMELTADQRSKLKSMVGDDYKPNNQDWVERFQRGPSSRMKIKRDEGN
jgi:hypothetical protein